MASAPKSEKREALDRIAEEQRTQLLGVLEAADREDLARRIRPCGAPLLLRCCSCGRCHQTAQRCRQKWCPVCARIRSGERAAKLRAAISKMADPAHLTLTMRNVTDWDRPHLKHLIESFARLRRTKIWSRCLGGAYGLEVTEKGRGWHPHLHAVIDCSWLSHLVPAPTRFTSKWERKNLSERAHAELCGVWGMCLRQDGADPSVWVRRCDSNAANEIAKYAIKPAELLSLGEKAPTLIDQLRSCRLTATFGSLRGVPLVEDESSTPSGLPCDCGSPEWMPDNLVSHLQGYALPTSPNPSPSSRSTPSPSRQDRKVSKASAELARQRAAAHAPRVRAT